MRKMICGVLQGAGGVLLLLAAGASDAGTWEWGRIVWTLAIAGLLLGAGTVGRRRRETPRRRARRAAA